MRISNVDVVPEEGVEPTRPCGQRILSPPRLPFRHSGVATPKREPLWGPQLGRVASLRQVSMGSTGRSSAMRMRECRGCAFWLSIRNFAARV